MADEFAAYVGDPDLHDAKVVAVFHDGADARVEAVGGNGRRYELVFIGGECVADRRAEGMRLYAVSEMRALATRVWVSESPAVHPIRVMWSGGSGHTLSGALGQD